MVAARIDADRTSVEFNSGAGIQSWMKAFTEVSDSVALQIARRDLNVRGSSEGYPFILIGCERFRSRPCGAVSAHNGHEHGHYLCQCGPTILCSVEK